MPAPQTTYNPGRKGRGRSTTSTAMQAAVSPDQARCQQLEAALAAEREAHAVLEVDKAASVIALQADLARTAAERNELAAQVKAALDANRALERDTLARVAGLQAELGRAVLQLEHARAARAAAEQAQAAEVSRLKAALSQEQKAVRDRMAEVKAQGARIAALERRIELDAEVMARRQAAFETSAMAARNTLSFKLGNLLINGFKSPRAIARLPRALLALRADAKSRRARPRYKGMDGVLAGGKGEVSNEVCQALLERFNSGGIAAVSAYLAAGDITAPAEAAAFTLLARHLQSVLPEKAAEAAREAYARDPQPYRAKWLAFRLFDAGFVVEPAEMLATLPDGSTELSVSELRRVEEILALARLRKSYPALETAADPAFVPVEGSLLYVTASALPYHTSGYTVRTHELAKALKAAGAEVTVLTRPGYPWDRADRKGAPREEMTVVDDVTYLHQAKPAQSLPLDVYFDQAARAIAEVARRRKVAAIHAASNHVNAMPALLAARSLGIPFIYEMRGLWDLSRASRVPNYEASERFQISMDLEAFIACNADRVYVISSALGEFIGDWRVDPARVSILPNCINADTIDKAQATQAAKAGDTFTVGYAGAMVGYEGLDVLIEAIAHLKARGREVNARLIGDGDMRASLEALVAQRGLAGQVAFLGKLAPERARAELVATSAVVIPRKPHRVCEIIPPIKLVEAMALGMPVIVPDLPVFREEVKSGETGVLFKAGDTADLARVIEQLMLEPEAAKNLGECARQYAFGQRSWAGFAAQIRSDLPALADLARRPPEPAAAPAPDAPPAVVTAPATPVIGGITAAELEKLLAEFERGGVAAVSSMLDESRTKANARAAAFTALARQLQPVCPIKAAAAAREAYAIDPRPHRAKMLAFRLFDAGAIDKPAQLLSSLGAGALTSASEKRRAEQIHAHARLRARYPAIHGCAMQAYVPEQNSLLYVAASAMPYHTTGYTVRTHELVRAIAGSGVAVTVLTRPGYPWDRIDSKGEPQGHQTVVDGILYMHRAEPGQSMPLDAYFEQAAIEIATVAKERRAAAIHAASNHVNALPALLAARSLGIPFVYEMRGLWELSRSSKVDAYDTSERFELGLGLEAFVAKNADRVYVISKALGQFVQGWGVDASRIAVLPNCINADTIGKAEETELAKSSDVFTVGYAGAMVGYEGLDVLIEAVAHLKARGRRVNARLIGDGDVRGQLEALAHERGLTGQVSFVGKLSPDRARAELVATNAVAIPRKPHHVCEIIPPIKLVEAMALGMPVIVPNLPVFTEEVESEETGILFKAGDAADLANALERLMTDPQLVAGMGARAREHARRERVWGAFAERIRDDVELLHRAKQLAREDAHQPTTVAAA